jgi:predicted ribosome quality control (RQC) complex YloA/Tae2 family protein
MIKYGELVQVIPYLQGFKTIQKAFRSDDNTIVLDVAKGTFICFDLRRGQSTIYQRDQMLRPKHYNAPFDVTLSKLNKATIDDVELVNNDKVIRFKLGVARSYKRDTMLLQFELTGKYTNAIVLDAKEVVVDALRHIDSRVSTRFVKIGQQLAPLMPPPFTPKRVEPIENIATFLTNQFQTIVDARLHSLQAIHTKALQKKIKQIEKKLASLEASDLLLQRSEEAYHTANILLANMDKVQVYDKRVNLEDFDGNAITITLPQKATVPLIIEDFFNQAKRFKNRAKNSHIEQNTLEEKRSFYMKLLHNVQTSPTVEHLNVLFPAKAKRSKQEEQSPIATFFLDGYKILLGKSKEGNIQLLKKARAKDIWFHIKDMNSAHVLVITEKKKIPDHIAEYAAALCVDFTTENQGDYEVDFTPRRNVRVVSGADVLYTDYETMIIAKDR